VTLTATGTLATGGRQEFSVLLPRPQSLELHVPFSEAPFNGTQLNAEINGHRLLPYVAFGGNKLAHDLVRKYDPDDGRVQEMHHWRQGLRPVLYDTAIKRGQPMGDLVDILMVHYDLRPRRPGVQLLDLRDE
jgi:hypothetical protein